MSDSIHPAAAHAIGELHDCTTDYQRAVELAREILRVPAHKIAGLQALLDKNQRGWLRECDGSFDAKSWLTLSAVAASLDAAVNALASLPHVDNQPAVIRQPSLPPRYSIAPMDGGWAIYENDEHTITLRCSYADAHESAWRGWLIEAGPEINAYFDRVGLPPAGAEPEASA